MNVFAITATKDSTIAFCMRCGVPVLHRFAKTSHKFTLATCKRCGQKRYVTNGKDEKSECI